MLSIHILDKNRSYMGDKKINATQFLPLKSSKPGYRDRESRNEAKECKKKKIFFKLKNGVMEVEEQR